MTGNTGTGHSVDRWLLHATADNLPTGWYDGMTDPLYAWESTGSIVLYDDRGHDTVSMANIRAREAAEHPPMVDRTDELTRHPSGVHYCDACGHRVILFDDDRHECTDGADEWHFREFAEAWEPVAEALALAAEDANLDTGGDRRAIVEHLATLARDILGDGWTVNAGALHGTRSGYRVYARADR